MKCPNCSCLIKKEGNGPNIYWARPNRVGGCTFCNRGDSEMVLIVNGAGWEGRMCPECVKDIKEFTNKNPQ